MKVPPRAIIGALGAPRELRIEGDWLWLGPEDCLVLPAGRNVLLWHTLAMKDARQRLEAALELEAHRRSGASVILVSSEPDLLLTLCDELWWFCDDRLMAQGDPREILEQYLRHAQLESMRALAGRQLMLPPVFRRGDGRAELIRIEALNAQGELTAVWPAEEPVAVRLRIQFRAQVEQAVVGVMIRTRTGVPVYGTNSELEQLPIAHCRPGEVVEVEFRFVNRLCPGIYVITGASHDPDGVWHDWVDDAIAVTVTDRRYTAGITNLRAQVTVRRSAR
jgi:lipopolysaccharide transport system ATP-binding protein